MCVALLRMLLTYALRRCNDDKRAASSYLLLYEKRDEPTLEQDPVAMIDA